MMVAAGCIVLGIASAAGAPPPGPPALDAFLARETNAIAARSVERILAAGSWDAKRRELRAELAAMLGLVPEPPRGDVQARVSGTIERAELGFAVDKLSFQPIPGLHISAALFRPLGSAGQHPAVLYLCGHGRVERDGVSYGNKAHYQHHGAWFARSGYVCLIVDTLLYAVAMSENQLYAYDLAAAGPVLRGRSLGKLLAHAASTDCRALCTSATGEVWAAVTTSVPESGQLLHVVSWRAGDARPRDHCPLRIANSAYTEFAGADGKPLPWHHGMRLTGDGAMVPQYPMGICALRDGTVYVTAIYPYTLLAAGF